MSARSVKISLEESPLNGALNAVATGLYSNGLYQAAEYLLSLHNRKACKSVIDAI